MAAKADPTSGDITEYQNIITTKIYRKPNYIISTNIIIDCFIVEPYCIIIIIMLS